MPKIKKGWLILISVLVFLTITNPSPQRWKEDRGFEVYGRPYNFIIFSIYRDTRGIVDDYYIGIAFNFFKVKHEVHPERVHM